jgi:hypothetical protein
MENSQLNTTDKNLANKYIIIGDELYYCTKHSKLYLFLNKLTIISSRKVSTDIIFVCIDGDNIKYNKYSPNIQEEKIKFLISRITVKVSFNTINFDNFFKIETSRHYNNGISIITTEDEVLKDYNDHRIIKSYRDYYSIVNRTTNIYGEKSEGSKYYEGFIPEYSKNLLYMIADKDDEYIYNLVGKHYKEFKYENIKPVLEHLRDITKKKSFSFSVITNNEMYSDSLVFSRYFKYETIKTDTGYKFIFKNEADYASARDFTDFREDFKKSKLFKWIF